MPSSLRAVAAPLLALLLVLAPGLAPAQGAEAERYLISAARLYENLEYERALEQLERAKKLSRGVDDDVAIALYEGLIRAEMGQKDQSVSAFKAGLFLKPDAKLPARVSPKVEASFEAVRADVKKELAPILARQEVERRKKEQEEAEARRKAEEARLAALRAAPVAGGTPARTDRPEQQPALTPPPPGSPGPLAAPGVEKRRALPVAPFVLLGVGVAAAGVGTYFGVTSQREVGLARSATFQDETVAHLRTASTDAIVANVLFGTAGAAAVAALITFLATPREPAAPPAETASP